jgi:D-aminopeptidase
VIAGDPHARTPAGRTRARGLGIPFAGRPGRWNAITDVPGVELGYATLIDGSDVRTGVTAIHPRGRAGAGDPWTAGFHSQNGNGEMTGLAWIAESGTAAGPICLTNTHAVGIAHAATVRWTARHHPQVADAWLLPFATETWDGYLNDINGGHVTEEVAIAALEAAASGPVEEGSVGGGTGMVCHGFKGGIGTASRVIEDGWTLGVLVQANHGRRPRLRVNGIPVGERIGAEVVPVPASGAGEGAGSIIVLIATDAPLLPGQCERVARRAGFGIARTGGMGERSSGDFALCFATGNRGLVADEPELALRMVNDGRINAFYEAVIDAVEESILNAMLASETMTGRNGHTVHGLPHALLLEALQAGSSATSSA